MEDNAVAQPHSRFVATKIKGTHGVRTKATAPRRLLPAQLQQSLCNQQVMQALATAATATAPAAAVPAKSRQTASEGNADLVMKLLHVFVVAFLCRVQCRLHTLLPRFGILHGTWYRQLRRSRRALVIGRVRCVSCCQQVRELHACRTMWNYDAGCETHVCSNTAKVVHHASI